ncbi:metallophosphoesterase [Actinoplanes siamensis]|uniref:Membrane protein n=1 Tax=Actinoplanes siamensis TaxID=1223317 RepID=A0A919TML1_9ACTN|nr:membrane protein [Actinoplanes siamensis]
MAFVAVILVLIGLAHYYLWRRLVRDTTRPGPGRRAGAVVAAVLGLLVPVTLIAVRAGYLTWLAWTGYLWIALMFYLLISLIVLEVPRLVVRLLWADRGRTAEIAEAPGSRGDAADSELLPAGSVPVTAASGSSAEGAGSGVASGTGRAQGAEDGGPERAGPTDDGAAERAGVDRRLLLARGAAIFAGLTTASVTGYGIRTATSAPRIDRVRIPIAKLPRGMDGTRLAVVSDIHLGPLTGIGHTERITRVINSVGADLVCVVGDLVDGTVAELGRLAEPLRGIESRRGAYFVTGNHEYYSGFQPWIDEVAELGMRPLRNERVEIDGLDLAGVNDLGGEEHGDPADFGKALGDRDPGRPVVLMAHQPLAAKDAAPYGVDLQVSGHTHGGQMAPFNLLVKLQQPVVSGFGRVDGVPVYVTNGAGFWGPPVRVGAPPQVTVIELRMA